MSQKVFNHITTTRGIGGGIEIAWTLNRQFKATQPYTFIIEVRKSGDNWEHVSTVVDFYTITDLTTRKYIPSQGVHYRLSLVDGNDNVYTTSPFIVNRYGSKTLIADELMRKERLVIENRSGRAGLLYKRKWYGDACEDCVSPDTGAVVNSKCDTCLGTGVQGGYFTPQAYHISFRQRSPRKKKIGETGNITSITSTGRGIAFPWLETGDVWVDQISNQRYIISAVQDVQYKQVPYVFNIELREAPQSDPVYKLDTYGLYKIIDGTLYLYDIDSEEFIPVALDSGTFITLGEHPDLFKVVGGKMYLLDISTGSYTPVALQNGTLVTVQNNFTYSVVGGSILMVNNDTGESTPVVLDGGIPVVDTGQDPDAFVVTDGQMRLKDISTGEYTTVALQEGSLITLKD